MRGAFFRWLCGILLLIVLVSAGNRSVSVHRSLRIFEALADTGKDAQLLKKLAEALKFRKKAITKEEKRVIAIINKIVKDSSVVTTQDLDKLRKELSGDNKAELDTLYKLIKQIEAQAGNTSSPEQGAAVAGAEKAPDNKNDQYIKELIDKILAKDKPQDLEERKKKQNKLKLIRQISQEPQTYIDTINDSTALERIVKLKSNAEVWGFHLYTSPDHDYNFKNFTALVYHSYEINPATGGSKNYSALQNVSLMHRAHEAGCKVILSATTENLQATSNFLKNAPAQKNFIRNTLKILYDHSADGINIDFAGMDHELAPHFMTFISYLSEACKEGKKEYSVNITLPPYDKEEGYFLNALAPFTDRFIINFTKKLPGLPGPLAPLKQQSDYSIETCVSRYLNTSNLSPEKLILCLPYYGVKWQAGTNITQILSYSQIRENYQNQAINYDEDAATAVISLKSELGNETGKIWFDDENTLGTKYDFILKSGLAGVAVRDLNADYGYGELNDELAYKFLEADTITARKINLRPYRENLHGWAFFVHALKTYIFVLENPCNRAHDHVDRTVLSYINLVLIVICAAIGATCILQIRKYGDSWKWKKTMLITLIFFVILLITTGFIWVYLDPNIPWFGVDQDCIDMPFRILYFIVIIGIILGLLVMRFLVFPVIRKEDIP